MKFGDFKRGREPDAPAYPAVLNEMNAAQRDLFFARLLSLTGSDATPSLRSREGSYYEYDSEVAGTVEITQDGRRFLVESLGGGELVRVREIKNPLSLENLLSLKYRGVISLDH